MLLIIILTWVSSALAQTPDQIKTMTFGSKVFTYLANQKNMDAQNQEITTAFLVVHGSELNSFNYFRSIQIVAEKLGLSAQTLILAPSFRTRTILPPGPNELSWTDEGWLRGDGSEQNRSLSSFDVMDRLISKIADPKLYPNLKTVVVTGHSAGGQLTQRYALASMIDSAYPRLHFRYLVLNPGSYVYLNSKRPENPHGCPWYDDYKFGLQHLNEYLSREPVQKLVRRYLQKDVTYFLGEADNDPNPGHVDQSCAAAAQGPHRYGRGLYFKAFLDSEFPGHRHTLVTAPNVIHSQRAMYTSPEGVVVLFPVSTWRRKPSRVAVSIQQ